MLKLKITRKFETVTFEADSLAELLMNFHNEYQWYNDISSAELIELKDQKIDWNHIQIHLGISTRTVMEEMGLDVNEVHNMIHKRITNVHKHKMEQVAVIK